MRLPQVSRRMSKDEVLLARGTADAFAMRLRYHNEALASRYAPSGPVAREIYDAMETARCEAMGALIMPGTAGNIDAKIAFEAEKRGFSQITSNQDAPLATAAGYMVHHLANGRPLPKGADTVLNLWSDFIAAQSGDNLGVLNHVLDDQAAFARMARKVISDLGYGDQLGDNPDQADEDGQDQEAQDEPDAPDNAGDDQDQSDASPEQSQEDSQDETQAQTSTDDGAEMEDGEEA